MSRLKTNTNGLIQKIKTLVTDKLVNIVVAGLIAIVAGIIGSAWEKSVSYDGVIQTVRATSDTVAKQQEQINLLIKIEQEQNIQINSILKHNEEEETTFQRIEGKLDRHLDK